MGILKQLQVHKQIVYDVTAMELEPMPFFYQRLAYLAGLREPTTGAYTHPALSVRYPAERVSEALEACHEEIFERVLEMPLAAQEKDLVRYFEGALNGEALNAEACLRLSKAWIPPHAPEYLKELYCANQGALCELVQENRTKAR